MHAIERPVSVTVEGTIDSNGGVMSTRILQPLPVMCGPDVGISPPIGTVGDRGESRGTPHVQSAIHQLSNRLDLVTQGADVCSTSWMNVSQIPSPGILAAGEKLTTDVSTGACESETGCTAPSNDWLDGCQQSHKVTKRGSRSSSGNGSGKGKKGGRDSKNAAQKGIVRSAHSKLPRATQPLL